MPERAATPCLTEDELIALGGDHSLADAPAAEAHLAECATCAALLGSVLAPARETLVGKQLGPYRLEHQIGAGGLGSVYRARDTRLDRAVAVKVLHAATDAKRLEREARAAAAVDHAAIVTIFDVGEADGIAFIAMELVDGESLRSVIARGPLPAHRVRALGVELCDALATAHARGVLHRDLKPENLVLTRGGLRILDFGLAKLADAGTLDVTEPGTVQGTAGYMAPEQARGEPVDARADVFAVGAILYELATGRRAFPGATHADRLTALLRDDPAADPLGELAPIVMRCLAKLPTDRFQTAADLAWVLRGNEPTVVTAARPSRRAWLVGAGAATLAGVAGYVLGRRRGEPRASRPELLQLTFRTGRVATARFSQDGNRVAFGAAWETEPLQVFVLDLAGGGATPLDVAGDVLAISQHGELAVCLRRRFTDHQSATGTLAVLPLAGGVPRVLAEDVQEADYAADGTLAVVRHGSSAFRIDVPIDRPLVETASWPTHLRISPNGRYAAYLVHPHTNDDAGDLVIVDLRTRATRTLTAGWASINGLAWRHDAGGLWFTGARGHGQCSLREVTLDGAVRELAAETGRLRLHDIAGDRRALVSLDAWRLRTLAGAPGTAPSDRSLSEVSLVTDLTADAAMLVVAELGNPQSASGAYLVPIAKGRPLRLGDGFPLAISPSGTRVVAREESSGGDRLVVYSTTSGERPAIAIETHIGCARWLDEQSLVAIGGGRLWRLALGASPVLLADRAHGPLAIDPARRRCAFVAEGQLVVVDIASGVRHVVPGTFANQQVCGWLAEPDAIVTTTRTKPLELVRVDPTTGASTPHVTLEPPPTGLRAVDAVVMHPDGVTYAYSYGQELSQLYVMRT